MVSNGDQSDDRNIVEEELEFEEDEIVRFVDSARSILVEEFSDDSNGGDHGPSWNWMFSRVLKTCAAYSSGVTSAILLSDLFQAWNEQKRTNSSVGKLKHKIDRKKQHRQRLADVVTIDSILEKNFLSLESSLEVVVIDAYLLPGTDIYMLKLGDDWSSNTIELYLHRKFYDLVDPKHGILSKGREIFLTGCHLRAATGGSGRLRLLPTEYLVIVLDEEQDADAMLLGARFCSDSFSSISPGSSDDGAAYAFYARIEAIGPLESHGKFGSLRRRQVTLLDNEDFKVPFLLWGEQVLLANLFSVGSMLALDRPFISNDIESNLGTSASICLEYGSATQLYLVPFLQQEGQVIVTSTPFRCKGSTGSDEFGSSQDLKVSQVSLSCDSQGSVDFSNYPSRLFVANLQNKMSSVCLYGIVKSIRRVLGCPDMAFLMNVEDATGTVVAKLHFSRSWSLGRLSPGHTIFISGLRCSQTPEKMLQVAWFEKDAGASLINLSALPAVLNSSCLHKSSLLSDLPRQRYTTHICECQIDQIELDHVKLRKVHNLCSNQVSDELDGIVQCSFCRHTCNDEVLSVFELIVTLVDQSAKIIAQCVGQTAAEILQISVDEFFELPEDEQALYLFTMQKENFRMAIVNCGRPNGETSQNSRHEETVRYEIVRALKCD